jgi:DNA-binding NarL/FixJ family response regulator
MRILIIDDHSVLRHGMVLSVREAFPQAEVTETTSRDALLAMEGSLVDVVLLDLLTPNVGSLQLLHSMQARWPAIPVIVVTVYDPHYTRRALAEGAAGYLLEEASSRDLEQAISVALSGGVVLSPQVLRTMLGNHYQQFGEEDGAELSRRHVEMLTQREIGILALVAEGKSNRTISRALFLSEKTVKAHLASIFRKLGLNNRTQAAMFAVATGIGPSEGSVDPEGAAAP